MENLESNLQRTTVNNLSPRENSFLKLIKSQKFIIITLSTISLFLIAFAAFIFLRGKTNQQENLANLSQPQPEVQTQPTPKEVNGDFVYYRNNESETNKGELFLAKLGSDLSIASQKLAENLINEPQVSHKKDKVAYISNGVLKVKDLISLEEKDLVTIASDVSKLTEPNAYPNNYNFIYKWTNDDNKLVYSIYDLEKKSSTLNIIDVDTKNTTKLLDDTGDPIISPDDNSIALFSDKSATFITDIKNNPSSYAIDLKSLNSKASSFEIGGQYWINNSEMVILTRDKNSYINEIFRFDTYSKKLTSLQNNLSSFGLTDWSEKNKSFLFEVNRIGTKGDLMIFNVDQKINTIKTKGDLAALWTKNEDKIAFYVNDNVLIVADNEGKNQRKIPVPLQEGYLFSLFPIISTQKIIYALEVPKKTGASVNDSNVIELWSINYDGSDNKLIDTNLSFLEAGKYNRKLVSDKYAIFTKSGEKYQKYFLLDIENLKVIELFESSTATFEFLK